MLGELDFSPGGQARVLLGSWTSAPDLKDPPPPRTSQGSRAVGKPMEEPPPAAQALATGGHWARTALPSCSRLGRRPQQAWEVGRLLDAYSPVPTSCGP